MKADGPGRLAPLPGHRAIGPVHWPDGIFVAPFEQGEIGPDLFRAACDMGLEGMV